MALSPKNLREMLFIVIGLMIVTIKSCFIVVSCNYMRTKTGQKYSNKGQKYVTFRFNQFDIKNHDVCQVFSQKKFPDNKTDDPGRKTISIIFKIIKFS